MWLREEDSELWFCAERVRVIGYCQRKTLKMLAHFPSPSSLTHSDKKRKDTPIGVSLFLWLREEDSNFRPSVMSTSECSPRAVISDNKTGCQPHQRRSFDDRFSKTNLSKGADYRFCVFNRKYIVVRRNLICRFSHAPHKQKWGRPVTRRPREYVRRNAAKGGR